MVKLGQFKSRSRWGTAIVREARVRFCHGADMLSPGEMDVKPLITCSL
ncbi:hypothetical protein GGE07_006478 [Sinorhizobium terangae]|nr:hypothetical protein [Sinorhizobium terangae]